MAQERKRRRFTAEYKAEAVKRLEESGKALQQVAAELGVHADQLRTWRNERLAAGSAEPWAGQGRGGGAGPAEAVVVRTSRSTMSTHKSRARSGRPGPFILAFVS